MDSSDSEALTATKPHKCKLPGCTASFSKNRKLINHIRRHTGERPFVCDVDLCDKTYTNSSHLQRHKKVSHGEKTDTEKVLCNFDGCGAVFANKYSLKKHYNRKHNSEHYAFKCTECSQGFSRKKQLQQHMYLHTGEATFSCDKCDMQFIISSLLNKHKRNHCEYYCDCNEVFYQWSLLLAHKKICHKKQYVCTICEKNFSQEGNLKNHKLVHLDKSERNVFVCGYADCKRSFFYKRNLIHHIQNFHQKINAHKTFNCTYPKCQVVLKTKQSQRQHLERHFKWKIKKTRKTRCDKGKLKKSVLSLLVIADTQRKNNETNEENITEGSNLQDQVCVNQDRIDDGDPIIKECQIVLNLLDNLVHAN